MSLSSSVCDRRLAWTVGVLSLSSRGRRVRADHPRWGHRRDDYWLHQTPMHWLVSAPCIVMLCDSRDVGCGPEGCVDECSLMWKSYENLMQSLFVSVLDNVECCQMRLCIGEHSCTASKSYYYNSFEAQDLEYNKFKHGTPNLFFI